MNSSTDISANVAQSSPMLVTVARNGSITSEASLLPRRSEEASSSPQNAVPVMSLVSRQRVDDSGSARLYSPASMGDESYTTARLFTGTVSPRGLETSNDKAPGADHAEELDARKRLGRNRGGSDVSDIAMRRHLVVDENSSASMYSELDTSSAHILGQFPQSHQRHYYPPVSHGLQTTAAPGDDSSSSPKEDVQQQLLHALLTRVSDLETRFTCMEALLASVEDELSELAVTPRTLGRFRRAVSATRIPLAGVRPVVGSVKLAAPSVAGLHSHTDLTSSPLLSTTAYDGPGDEVSDDLDREDTVVAVQTTAAALAELVSKSREEFDEATNSALSSISALVNGMQTMRRLDKSLVDATNETYETV
ncbi:hypothetical protein GGI21_004554 [Coemansia aciculifera]|nr:hypothetical protein GGI21_004554 [Coemansia aciculifera]